MKIIGIIGGMSWESTLNYYKYINQGIKSRLGGLHSAKLCLVSVDFAKIASLQQQGDWSQMTAILVQAGHALRAAGAECIVIATNTMHKVATEVEHEVGLPLLHIADATGQALQAQHHQQVALLGTKFTMQQRFYLERLERLGIECLVPTLAEQDDIHRIIYDELCQGEIKLQSKQRYLDIIARLHEQGASAIILGCTEIALLVEAQDCNVPLFDTTALHAQAAVEFALSSY